MFVQFNVQISLDQFLIFSHGGPQNPEGDS